MDATAHATVPGRLMVLADAPHQAAGGGAWAHLVGRGWHVHVVHLHAGDTAGVDSHGVRHSHLSPSAEFAALHDLVSRLRPDAAHLHGTGAASLRTLAVLGAHGVRAVLAPEDYAPVCARGTLRNGAGALCDGPALEGLICRACTGDERAPSRPGEVRDAVLRGIHACVVPSDALRAALTAHGYPARMVRTVRPSTDVHDALWDTVGRHRTPGRRDPAVLTLVFIGDPGDPRAAAGLATALRGLDLPVRVLLHGAAGRGPGHMHAEVLDLRDRPLAEALAQADVAVLPATAWDPTGDRAATCLAAGLPVIANRVGALPELITHEVDGLLVPAADPDALRAALERLADDALLTRLRAGVRAPRGLARWVDDLTEAYAGRHAGEETPRGPVAVRWVGDLRDTHSLAHINREVTARLAELPGIDMQALALDDEAPSTVLPHPVEVEVRHSWPPGLGPHGSGRIALIQPWEFGRIPRDWVQPFREVVDELWVPSEYVRGMYVDAGAAPDRVHVVPNGVDLDLLAPEGPAFPVKGVPDDAVRFLFLGGVIGRKGPDVLLDAWKRAFGPDDNVVLIIKDYGEGSIYRTSRRELREAVRDRRQAPIVHLTDELTDAEIAALYRSADVLVHPYRGEGFAMPVLEAMACGRPVIITAGGPTDEFCPDAACWRIRSERREVDMDELNGIRLTGNVWLMEPEPDHLVELLREAVAVGAEGRALRGAAARRAAEELGWDRVAAMYAERIHALRERPLRTPAARPAVMDEARPRLLASPAWRRPDELAALLSAWVHGASAGTLVLMADPDVDGGEGELGDLLVAAAERAGVDLEHCPDIVVRTGAAGRAWDAALVAACDAVLEVNPGAPGLARLAREAGSPVVTAIREAIEELTARAAVHAPHAWHSGNPAGS